MDEKIFLFVLMIGLSIGACLASEPRNIFGLRYHKINKKAKNFIITISAKALEPKEVYSELASVLEQDVELWPLIGPVTPELIELARYDKKDPLKNCNHEEFAEFQRTCILVWWSKNLSNYCTHCIGEQRKRCASYGAKRLFNYVSHNRIKSHGFEADRELTLEDGIKANVEGRLDSSGRRDLVKLCARYIENVEKDMAIIHGDRKLDYLALVKKSSQDNRLVWRQCTIMIKDEAANELNENVAGAQLEGQLRLTD